MINFIKNWAIILGFVWLIFGCGKSPEKESTNKEAEVPMATEESEPIGESSAPDENSATTTPGADMEDVDATEMAADEDDDSESSETEDDDADDSESSDTDDDEE